MELCLVEWLTFLSAHSNEALSNIPGAALLSGPDWLPASIFPAIISKNPDFSDPVLFISTIYYFFILVCVFYLIRAVLAYIARVHRGLKMAVKVFSKDLDKFDIEAINGYSSSVNSPVPGSETQLNK